MTADDLGPLGRLVAPGEMLVMAPHDEGQVRMEREWVNARYLEADSKAESLRQRMWTARQGMNGDQVREGFEEWTVEAAKLALCDRYLRQVAGQLDQGNQQAMSPKAGFRWDELPQIREVIQRVINAADSEILGGVVFRAK